MTAYSFDILLNDFAIRSFRDIADKDYIVARLAHRAQLGPQFLWSGLQALEKYLKCILVLNRIPARRGHHIGDLLAAFGRNGRFTLSLSPPTLDFIKHLDLYGRHRYFEVSYFIEGHDMLKLDRAVWEVRRYAQVLEQNIGTGDGKEIDLLQHNLDAIERAARRPPQSFAILGGHLEHIISTAAHPARGPLLWKNLFFGTRARKGVWITDSLHSANAPLLLRPEILDEVLKYVWLPKDVIDAYREHATSGTKY